MPLKKLLLACLMAAAPLVSYSQAAGAGYSCKVLIEDATLKP